MGVGSVGMLAFVLLMQGRDENDLIVLQAKQAVASVLETHTNPSAFAQSGEARRDGTTGDAGRVRMSSSAGCEEKSVASSTSVSCAT